MRGEALIGEINEWLGVLIALQQSKQNNSNLIRGWTAAGGGRQTFKRSENISLSCSRTGGLFGLDETSMLAAAAAARPHVQQHQPLVAH